MKVLVIEDDQGLALDFVEALEHAGHQTVHAADGKIGLKMAREMCYDAILLDRILPGGIDGIEILKTLRRDGDHTPIIMMSGLATVQDKVDGLRAGANDYVAKPLSLHELVARVEATNLPRKMRTEETMLIAGDVEIDLLNRSVTRAGHKIELQPREFKLLEYLARHANQVVTRKQLLEAIWKTRFDPGTSVIEVHLSRLRKKIDSPFQHHILHTVRNAGFTFRPAPVHTTTPQAFTAPPAAARQLVWGAVG